MFPVQRLFYVVYLKAFFTQMMTTGQRGEQCVVALLEGRGWRIVLRNWRDRYAEVDIVALSPKGGLHLVEVKTRATDSHSRFALEETLSKRQLRRLRQAFVRLLPDLPNDVFWNTWHIDAAFVMLDQHRARVSFLPDCHG